MRKFQASVKKLSENEYVSYRTYNQLTFEKGASETEAIEKLEKSLGGKAEIVIDKYPDAFAHSCFQ